MRSLSILILFLPAVVQAQGTFKVLEAKENVITLQAGGPDFDQGLFLSNQTGEAQTAKITISELRAAGGSVARIETSEIPGFGPKEAKPVQLKGRLPEVGDFKGLLSIQAGTNPPQEFVLVIQRVQGMQQISLEAVPEGPIYRLVGDPDAEVRIRLTETTGASGTFQKPVLTKLLQEVSATYQPGAKYERAVLTVVETHPVLPATFASVAGIGSQASGESLPKHGTREYLLKIERLEGSGKYLGTALVATPNGVLTQTFVLFIKHHWFYAALAILAGVWASYWLRFWLQVGRPRALKELLILRFEQEVRRVVPEADNPVRLALEAELQVLRETLLLDGATEVAAELDKKREILENYRIVRSVIVLGSQLEGLPQELIRKIRDLDQRVREGGLEALAGQQDGSPLVKEAREIRGQLLEGARKSLTDALEVLRKGIEEENAALEAGRLDPADRQRCRERLDQAATHRAAALKAVQESGEAAEERVASALLRQGWKEYGTAGELLLAASVTRFRHEIELQTDPPLGVEGWNQLREDLLRQLPPEATAEQYAQVRRRYLRMVLEGLQRAADTAAQQAATQGQTQAQQGFRSVAERAKAARDRLDQVTMAELQKLREDYQQVLDSLPGQKPMNSATEGLARARATGVLPGADPLALPGVPPLPEDANPVQSKDDLIRSVQSKDKTVAIIVSVVSVLLGLSLLWSTNETFGSLEDYIGAILWGFGLHELNKMTMPDAALSGLGLALPQAQAKQR